MPEFHLALGDLTALLSTKSIGKAPGWANEVWDTIDSTNIRAAQLAAEGAPEGIIVAARHQSAGRGRLGRQWVSPPDSGLYISFLLRPRLPMQSLPLFSLAAGVAAAEAIYGLTGYAIGLKWVNDLVADGRKLGGILAEMPPTGLDARAKIGGNPLVIGIGINLSIDETTLPDELQGRVSYLESLCHQPVNPNQLAASLAERLEHWYDMLNQARGNELVAAWKKYGVTLGTHIRATSGDSQWEGEAVDIAPDGALILRQADGKTHSLHSGEITIRRTDGSYY